MSSFNERAETYNRLAAEACRTLDDQLGRIRHDYDGGEISLLETARERIQCLEEHLTRLRLLRDEYLS